MTETSQWQHVASEDNPADLVSRGLEPSRLVNNELWWHGPSFIQSDRRHSSSSVIAEGRGNKECYISGLFLRKNCPSPGCMLSG
ncbi:hypothetical protein JTE90_027803 [Oedothorax gibbosus]|uniref:Uncharacterized protein n=1 Tax=Oedothorax gibbosus TaxID=931172 RepID=A0AAV6V954_9ARAC|nr:hypothetical protein JTE90_027803 [Oedothorax gibbosus]